MAPGLQLVTEGGEVIDLAVDDHPECAVLVAHGLAAGFGQVNDAQAPMAEAATDSPAMVQIDAKVVGPPMFHHGGHPPHEALVDLFPTEVQLTADPAHGCRIFSDSSFVGYYDSRAMMLPCAIDGSGVATSPDMRLQLHQG